MEKKLFWWEVGAAAFTLVFGTLLHFTYEWSGEAAAVGAFSAVNESVWEHMKLIAIPMFLEFFVHARFLGAAWPNLPAVRAAVTLLGTALIPVIYYTYTGIFGDHTLWADIALFIFAVLLAYVLEFFWLIRGRLSALWMQVAGLLFLWGMAAVFVWCTFAPPELSLWQDPITGQYGR